MLWFLFISLDFVSRGVLAIAEGKVFIRLAGVCCATNWWKKRWTANSMINSGIWPWDACYLTAGPSFVPLRLPPYARDPLNTHAWSQIRLERPVGSIRSPRELATFKVRNDIGIPIACSLGIFLYNTSILILWLLCPPELSNALPIINFMTKLIWYQQKSR